MFSDRTSWNRLPNHLSQALERRRQSGSPVVDLTVSNPTACGFNYAEQALLSAFANPSWLHYHPDARGLFSARTSIAQLYAQRSVVVNPGNIFLTASTSEAYALLFNVLCNSGERVLLPRPSYPLFDYLSQLNDIHTDTYRLFYDHGWHVDFDSIRQGITSSTRAIVLIHPHNPTGMVLRRTEFDQIVLLAHEHNLALIVDEVFSEYRFEMSNSHQPSAAGEHRVLTFTLNGLSKMAALPQLKLGWIVVSGPEALVAEASARLEIMCDTFLSVNTPVQIAFEDIMQTSIPLRETILNRVRTNYTMLTAAVAGTSCSVLESDGGWCGIIRVPTTMTDEAWALALLENEGIHLFPGYFFDLEEEGHLVVSLLPETGLFRSAVTTIVSFIESNTAR